MTLLTRNPRSRPPRSCQGNIQINLSTPSIPSGNPKTTTPHLRGVSFMPSSAQPNYIVHFLSPWKSMASLHSNLALGFFLFLYPRSSIPYEGSFVSLHFLLPFILRDDIEKSLSPQPLLQVTPFHVLFIQCLL